MTENPLYRRVYGYDNPLPQYRSSWRPPSDSYVMQENRYPNAAQDLRNLFGTFFTPNSATQYQPSPYQMIPTGYNPYATNNISPAQQKINQRIGDALHSYTPPSQYKAPIPYEKATSTDYTAYQPNTFRDDSPQAAQNAQYAREKVYDTIVDKIVPAALIGVTTGGLGYGLGSLARPYVPYALARLGATRYGKPIVDGINRFAETPVGKMLINVADFIF